MEHPEEIYKDINGKEMSEAERLWGEGMNRRHVYDLGHESGYEAGKAEQPDPLAGYSNLTTAISAGDPIDWAKLDGKKVQCDKPDVGTLEGELKRRGSVESDSPDGWWKGGMDYIYVSALIQAWRGENGWTLWLEGEIPLVRKTADQLEQYTYFRGKSGSGKTYLLYVGFPITSDRRNIRYAPSMLKSFTPADEWEVLEEYGTFPKLEGR